MRQDELLATISRVARKSQTAVVNMLPIKRLTCGTPDSPHGSRPRSRDVAFRTGPWLVVTLRIGGGVLSSVGALSGSLCGWNQHPQTGE